MEITSVKIHKVERENSNIIGIANIVIDNAVAIHDIKIKRGDDKLYISMPYRKTPTGDHRDYVHPISSEVRTMFEKAIFDAYEAADDSDAEATEE